MRKFNREIFFLTTAICISFKLHGQDPAFYWANQMGGISNEEGYSIITDDSGNVYSTGYFYETADFDPGNGTFNLTSGGGADIFISKLDAYGNFVWAKQFVGAADDDDLGLSIKIDAHGNVYTTGWFYGTADFDPGPGTYDLTPEGSEDVFVSKLDNSGNFVWAKRLGGSSNDVGYSISLDAEGNVYTAGYFWLTADFDPGVGTYNLTASWYSDIFISKLDSSGNFVWAKKMGGTMNEQANSIIIDSHGNVYTTGFFYGTVDFNPNAGTFNLTSAGGPEIFVSKLDGAGNFIWAISMGGSDNDYGNSITTDAMANIYITGIFKGTADFDPGLGTFNLTSLGNGDIFVSKLDSSGNFVWAKRMGGTSDDYGGCIAADITGSLYITGSFQGTADFDPGAGTQNITSIGSHDVFVSKLDTAGSYVWAVSAGSVANDYGFSITTDSIGNVYSTGYFSGIADFDPGTEIFNLTSAGSEDIFLLKMSQLADGIAENNVADKFTIFPNPTKGNFTIRLGMPCSNVTARVMNVTGQEISSVTFSNVNLLNFSIDAPAGFYIIEMKTSDGKLVRTKVIKE